MDKALHNFKAGDKVERWITVGFDSTKQQDIVELIGGVVTGITPSHVFVDWETGLQKTEFYDGIRHRDWLTPAEEAAARHNPKTSLVFSIVIFQTQVDDKLFTNVAITRQKSNKCDDRRIYNKPEQVDRLLTLLNTDGYERVMKRGFISGCFQVNVTRK